MVALEHLVVGDVAEGVVWCLNFEAVGEAWVVRAVKVESEGAEGNGGLLLNGFELEIGFDLFETDGEEFGGEKVGDEFSVRAADVGRGPDGNVDAGLVNRVEKGDADEMVPVGMTQEEMDLFDVLFDELLAELADARTCIEDADDVIVAKLKGAGVAAELGVLGPANRARTAGAPKFKIVLRHPNPHLNWPIGWQVPFLGERLLADR